MEGDSLAITLFFASLAVAFVLTGMHLVPHAGSGDSIAAVESGLPQSEK